MKFASSLVLLTSDHKLVLQKRTDSPNVFFSGCWGLIGGAATDDEDEMQCILRECYEEVNWKPDFLLNLFTVKEHCIETVFYSEVDSVESLKCLEGEELRAFEYEELNSIKISVYHRNILNNFFKEYVDEQQNSRFKTNILFYTKVLPPAFGGYVTAGVNYGRVISMMGKTTLVSDDTIERCLNNKYDILFFNATYEGSSVFDLIRKNCRRICTIEHNKITDSNSDEMIARMQAADVVIVPSEFLKNLILKDCKNTSKINGDKIEIVPIPINNDVFSYEYRDSIINETKIKFVSMCAIKPVRNLQKSISLIRHLVAYGLNCEYDIYGKNSFFSNSSYFDELQYFIKINGLDKRVKFKGAVIGSFNISKLLREYDYYLDFSEYETYGQAKIEAVLSGLYLIVPDNENNNSLLPKGFVFFNGDIESVAKRVFDLISLHIMNPKIKVEFEKKACLYSWEHFTDHVVRVILQDVFKKFF